MQKISVSGPAELLTIVPFHLGFEPTRSVVVVCFHDKRLGLVARLDAEPPGRAAAAALHIMPVLDREQPTAVALIGFEDVAGESAPLSDALSAALGPRRIRIHERLTVRDGRWYCAADCVRCPLEGTPMPHPQDVPAVADYVATGRAVLPNREALVALLAGNEGPEPHVAAAIDLFAAEAELIGRAVAQLPEDLIDLLAGFDPDRHLRGVADEDDDEDDEDDDEDLRDWLDGVGDPDDGLDPELELDDAVVAPRSLAELQALLRSSERILAEAFSSWRRLLTGHFDDRIPDEELPRLLGCLRDVHIRDALIAWLRPGTLRLDQLPGHLVDALDEHLGLREPEAGRGGAIGPPSVDCDDVLLTRVERLCRRAPDAQAAPVLAIAASLAWGAGDGARALTAATRAVEVEPDHRLSLLLLQLVEHGIRSGSEPRTEIGSERRSA